MALSYSGERPETTGELSKGRELPEHLRPVKDNCVVKPPTKTYICTQFGTEVWNIPGTIICSDPDHHDHYHPLPDPEDAWADNPGWTPPQFG